MAKGFPGYGEVDNTDEFFDDIDDSVLEEHDNAQSEMDTLDEQEKLERERKRWEEKKAKEKEEAEAEEEDFDVVVQRERLRFIALYGLEGLYGMQGNENTTIPIHDVKGHDDRMHDHFENVYNELAAVHAVGDYHKTLDTHNPEYAIRPGVRAELAAQSEENMEIDIAITDKANHCLNISDKMLQNGGDFTQCTYTDKDGNPVNFDWESFGDTTKGLETIAYGIDHGLIQCQMPNGEMLDPKSIGDGYLDKLDYYDSMEPKMAAYMVKVEEQTREKFENATPEQKAELIPDYIKDEAKRASYEVDAKAAIDRTKDMYQGIVNAYEHGANPYELAIIKRGDYNEGMAVDVPKSCVKPAKDGESMWVNMPVSKKMSDDGQFSVKMSKDDVVQNEDGSYKLTIKFNDNNQEFDGVKGNIKKKDETTGKLKTVSGTMEFDKFEECASRAMAYEAKKSKSRADEIKKATEAGNSFDDKNNPNGPNKENDGPDA